MNTIINNSFVPLNKNKFIEELKRLGIPEATIENIKWKNCIEDGYCIYNDKKTNKTCFTKIQNKSNKLCSVHKNKNYDKDINEMDNMFKNMEIDTYTDIDKINNLGYINDNVYYFDDISETICNSEITNRSNKNINCIHLNEEKINILYKDLTLLLEEINYYKNKKSININDINILYKSILKYNNNLYESEEEPHICISFLLQFFEELYEISNNFFKLIIDNYDNFEIFIELCKKWKIDIKELTKEIIIIPDYYSEYYVIINKKINDNLFKELK